MSRLNPYIKPTNAEHAKILVTLSNDMLLFGKVCVPTMFSVKTPPFHKEIAGALDDEINRKLNIIAPRGHAKSSVVAGLKPLHHLFFEPGPKLIVLISKTEGHAIRLLQTIKNTLEYSMPLRALVGYWGEHSAKVWKNNEVVLKDNTMIICRGAGQMVVGLKHINQRPTLIILDDPEDMNNTKTAEAMEFNLRWLLQALIPSMDALRGRIVVIGTPQHERCMVEVLKAMEGWKTMFYQAIQSDGTALWPELWPIERLLEEKASLESVNRVSSFYREYQCTIIGDEDQLFKEQYFKYWDGYYETDPFGNGVLHITHLNNEKLAVMEDVPVNVFMGVDPASSTAQTADYSAIVPIAVDNQGRRFILDYFRKHVTPMALAEAILDFYYKYKPTRTRIESVGYQEMLREYLRSKEYIPGLEIKEMPRTAKSNRLESLEPFFYKGQIYMKPTHRELKDELLLYPRAKHDDLLDGLFYANKGTYKPQHEASNAIASKGYADPEAELDWMLA